MNADIKLKDKLTRRDAIRAAAFVSTAALVTGRPAFAQTAPATRPAGGVGGNDFDFKGDNPSRDNTPQPQGQLAHG